MELGWSGLRPRNFPARAGSEVWQCEVAFRAPERVQVVGPSGTGKTSFTRFLAGFSLDFEGQIRFDGQDTRTWSPEDWALVRQNRLGLLHQTLRLFPDLNGWENLHLFAGLGGRQPEPDARETWAAQAELLGLKGKLDQRVGTLSQGERQRLSVIRCLSRPFRWLLLDEPFSHLDAENARKVWNLVTEAAAHTQAGLIVTALEPLPANFEFDRRLSI